MLNYPLTEFSFKELDVLRVIISKEIREKRSRINAIEQYFFGDSDTRCELLKNSSYGLSELEEIRTRVLTAIDIVKQKETTNAN